MKIAEVKSEASQNSNFGPVFVVGMNGSGTTMLADCLGHHPELYMFPQETYVLPYYIKNQRQFGDLQTLEKRKKLAQSLARHKAYWSINGEKYVQLNDEQLDKPGVVGVIDGLYHYFAAKKGKRRWGDKTPMYIQHMPLLAEVFPNAKFVHIYRDGRDIAQSLHRRWHLEPRRSIYRWRKTLEMARINKQLLAKGQYIEIAYEKLTQEPESSLRSICQFLELPYQASVLSSSMPHMGDTSSQAEGKIIANSDKWRDYFSDDLIMSLENIAGKTLREYGYEVSNPNGCQKPNTFNRGYWLIHDRVLAAFYEYRRYGPKYLKVLGKRARDSLIQLRTNKF